VAFSPDGKVLAAFGESEPLGIRLWDVGTRRVIETVPGLDGAFSPDGRAFASSMFWTLRPRDVRTGAVLRVPPSWVPKHTSKGERRAATVKLRRYFRRMGFKRLGRTPYYALSMSQVTPGAAELLGPAPGA
jgi:hypothetical protein